MAYKFQIGAAVLSGSIKAEDGLVATDVDDTTAANIVAQIDDGEIAFAKLASLTSGQILVGNASNKPAGVAMSGDIGISNAGLTTIQSNAVEGSMLDSNVADGSSIEVNSNALRVRAGGVTNTMLSGSIADSKLNTISTAGKVDIGALEIDGASEMGAALADADLLIVDDGANGTEKSMLASRIPTYVFSKVSGDATVASGGALSLANDSVGADQLASNAVVDASVASNAAILASKIQFNTDLGGNVTFGNQSDDTVTFSGGLIIAGDLTVQGAAVEVQQGFVVTSSVAFEGATPDGNEISLTSADPSADQTITLPDLTGHVPLIAGAIGNANVTSAEFLLLDGNSTVGTSTLADADGFMHNDNGTMKQTQIVKIAELAFSKVSGDATIASGGALTIASDAVEGSMLNDNVISGQDDINAAIVSTDELLISDNGTIKRTDMSRLKTYIGGGTVAVNAIGDANASLAVGMNVATANASANRTWTLPASAGLSAGDVIVIKAYGNAATYPITIACQGSQGIDSTNEDQILLESNDAAISLYYVDTDVFVIV